MKSVTKLFILYFKANASAIRISEILNIEDSLDINEEDLNLKNTYKECNKNDLDIDSIKENQKIKNIHKESTYHIQFKNVTFCYNKNIPVVKNINFELKKGESLGIIGAIGSGKTTIMMLLMGFYKSDKGQILINNVDINDMKKSELRNMFGSVFQNDYLFSKTIYENIDFGRNLDGEDIVRAAKAAQEMDFINQKEAKFDENISQSGNNLSGGQKQRIFLSRAFAGKPEILILDYACSALDFKTDRLLRESLEKYYKNTTKIIIESRINSIKNCTKIMVLDKGNVVGYGKHEDLIKSCDIYSEINKIQNGDL